MKRSKMIEILEFAILNNVTATPIDYGDDARIDLDKDSLDKILNILIDAGMLPPSRSITFDGYMGTQYTEEINEWDAE